MLEAPQFLSALLPPLPPFPLASPPLHRLQQKHKPWMTDHFFSPSLLSHIISGKIRDLNETVVRGEAKTIQDRAFMEPVAAESDMTETGQPSTVPGPSDAQDGTMHAPIHHPEDAVKTRQWGVPPNHRGHPEDIPIPIKEGSLGIPHDNRDPEKLSMNTKNVPVSTILQTGPNGKRENLARQYVIEKDKSVKPSKEAISNADKGNSKGVSVSTKEMKPVTPSPFDTNNIFRVVEPAADDVHVSIRKRPGLSEEQSPVEKWSSFSRPSSPHLVLPAGQSDRPMTPRPQTHDTMNTISNNDVTSSSQKTGLSSTGMKSENVHFQGMESPVYGSSFNGKEMDPALDAFDNYEDSNHNSRPKFLVNMAEIRSSHQPAIYLDGKEQGSENMKKLSAASAATEEREDKGNVHETKDTISNAPAAVIEDREDESHAKGTVGTSSDATLVTEDRKDDGDVLERAGIPAGTASQQTLAHTSSEQAGLVDTTGKEKSTAMGNTKDDDTLLVTGDGSSLDRKEMHVVEKPAAGPSPFTGQEHSQQLMGDLNPDKPNRPLVHLSHNRLNLLSEADKLNTPSSLLSAGNTQNVPLSAPQSHPKVTPFPTGPAPDTPHHDTDGLPGKAWSDVQEVPIRKRMGDHQRDPRDVSRRVSRRHGVLKRAIHPPHNYGIGHGLHREG
ncbi:hypothetical protein ACOMHN_034572 [Nucella lapillus]